MGEERLVQITSDIIRLDGPLGRAAYLSSMQESDRHLLLRYIVGSKYKNMNVLNAILAFSYEYLKSKDMLSIDDIKNYSFLESEKVNNNVVSLDEIEFSDLNMYRGSRR